MSDSKDDPTEQRKAEERDAQLAAIVQSSNDAIISETLSGIITSWNPAAQRMYGYSAAEAVGQSICLIVPPERTDELRNILQKVGRGEPLEHLETIRQRKDGTRFNVSVTISPIKDSTGQIIGASAIARDLSEHERLEATLREYEEYLLAQQRGETERVEAELALVRKQLVRQARFAAIGQISASIAHDLRNPLSAIRNAAYLLKRRTPATEPKLLHYLQIIDEEVASSEKIINDLMEMTSAKEPEKQAVDLENLVQDLCPRLALPTGVQCQWICTPSPFLVWADPNQLRQVFSNLLLNAAQAMKEQGIIEVRAMRQDGWDVLTVSDTGPGIAPEHLDHIFEPLFTTKAKGVGLGLTICRQIVERHGGVIEALLPRGSGAIFCLRLPHL